MDETLKPGQNTGLRMDPIRPTDFYAGGESGAVKQQLRADGQFDNYLPDEEAQSREGFDAFNCVSESADNSLEVIFNLLLASGLFSLAAVKFLRDNKYIDPMTGKVNFSDRYTAKMSGTTENGNSLPAVGDAIRLSKVGGFGLVPESVYPWPKTIVAGMTRAEAWAIYYKEVPADIVALGKKFLEFFAVDYEWIVLQGITKDPAAAIKAALPFGPVQIAAAVCAPWNSNEANPPIPACGCGTQHATIISGDREDGAWKDFDSYKSFRKFLAADYCIPYAFQYHVHEILTPAPATPDPRGHVFALSLHSGDPDSPEVRMLQAALQYLKDKTGSPFMKVGVFGPYGLQTKAAVKRFQVDNGIVDDDGSNFGPRTRAVMNKKLQ